MANHSKRYVLTGVITVIPIMVTVFVIAFFIDLLSGFGRLKVLLLAKLVQPYSPELAQSLIELPWLQAALAILLTLGLFYLLGWAVSRILGRRILRVVESLLARIPMVTTIYGATKQLLDAFSVDQAKMQRVVLIEFPREGMKTIGFVTQTMIDESGGGELASVYVPTAPNPTSGYLVIVPVADLLPLDWTIEEAMTFVIAGGATAPRSIRYRDPAPSQERDPPSP